MKPRVLVVEDEADLRSVLGYNLRLAGYEVEEAGSAHEALRMALGRAPDLVILDLMLPDFPGTEVCRELRRTERTRDVPVLILTAKGEEANRVVGFEIGADDYVVKPVSMRELVLRVAALLRRRTKVGNAPPDQTSVGGETLRCGVVKVDREAHQAYVGTTPIDLTRLELRLLATLLSRAGRVQTRERLLAEVWELEDDATSRTVDTHIKRLRAKLGSAAELIETVRGAGYRYRREEGA